MNKITLKVLLLLCLAACALAGWERTYGGSDNDCGRSVIQNTDGGYLVVGETYSFSADDYNIYLVKTDSLGDTIWTRTFGGDSWDYGYSVAQTTDGGFIVVGRTYSFGAGSWDVYLIKSDSFGDTIWTRTYGGSNADGGYSIAQTSDGGYIVAGYTFSFGAIWEDVYLLKLTSSGDTVWTRTYGGSSSDIGYSVTETTDGGYIVAGKTYSYGVDYDVYVLKLSSLGDTVWTRVYGGDYWDCGESVLQTSDSEFIVAGHTVSYGAGAGDVYLIKIDLSGDTVWTRTYGGPNNDLGYSITKISDGGFAIAGETSSFGAGMNDVYLIKTDSLGNIIWSRTYGGSNYDRGYSIMQTTDGGFIITGQTQSFGAGDNDVYLIKTDSLGYTAIGESPSARPENIAIRAYPNPFNSSVRISVETQDFASLQIEIFDINGRNVANIPVGATPRGRPSEGQAHGPAPTTREFTWTPDESIGSGVYLVRIKGTNAAVKVIYIK